VNLWLLQRPDNKVGYDERGSFIVRAESEEAARAILQKRGPYGYKAWTAAQDRQATCVVLEADGEPGIIMEQDEGA
jgi:hypothetical protein